MHWTHAGASRTVSRMTTPRPLPSRRELLVAGSVFGASALAACAAPEGPHDASNARSRAQDEDKRDAPAPGLSPIVAALVLGLHAPSPHNTQSWRFRLVSDRECLLFVDPRRLLPETDPPARQIHIGCGTFAEAFVLGASRLGHAARVEPFPMGPYPSPSAVGTLPVARLVLTGERAAPDPLAAFLEARQTSRLPHLEPRLAPEMTARVLADMGAGDAEVTFVPSAGLDPYLELFERAMEVESTTRATNEETRRWFRFDGSAAKERRDGLTFEANGITGTRAFFARLFTSDTEASWNAKGTIEKGLASFREAVRATSAVAFVTTGQNGHDAHLAAGRATMRLMLAATRHGLFTHPVNQILQEYEAMRPLREAFEARTGVTAPRKIQMILRVGRTPRPFLTYRRHAGDLFVRG